MNDREKEVYRAQLAAEKEVLKKLENLYKSALDDIDEKIKVLQSDELTQSKIYQAEYQKALRGQIAGIVEKLHGDEYTTIQQYLHDCYTDGFVGTMYDIHGQGIPLIIPIDQNAAVKAIQLDSKINEGLYKALGVDATALKKTIQTEVSRGIATGLGYSDIARNISNASKAPRARAMLITRTESHRITQASTYDAQKGAKKRGCDVLKQWDATMDGDTRSTHRQLDGQLREIKKPFELGNKKAMYPGDFGDPAEDCNCRCVSNTRVKWDLDEDELETLKERAAFFGLDKTEELEEFKKKYIGATRSSGKVGDSDGYSVIDEVTPFNFLDKIAIKKEVEGFMETYSKAKEEHAIVISPNGYLYRLTGTVADVNTSIVGEDALVGSIGIHNHPVWDGFESGDSFSRDDVWFSAAYKTGKEYLSTGTKRYAFEYTGDLSADELAAEYEKAITDANELAFETDSVIEFEQEAAMRLLAERLKGFVFDENL